jgi:hypothetical protein
MWGTARKGPAWLFLESHGCPPRPSTNNTAPEGTGRKTKRNGRPGRGLGQGEQEGEVMTTDGLVEYLVERKEPWALSME